MSDLIPNDHIKQLAEITERIRTALRLRAHVFRYGLVEVGLLSSVFSWV